MITIYAEKPDMGTKIAAALDGILLENGKKVSFEELEKYERQIKAIRAKNGFLKIIWEGQDVLVTWGYGHMCCLKQASDYNEKYRYWTNMPLPYIPEEYDLKLIEGAEKQYKIVRKCFMKSDMLICATDNDREGDLIFDYLYRYMKCKIPFKRAIFNKQSKEEYRKAFSSYNLVDSKDRLPVIEAGRARSAGDFIVGAGPTVAMTLKNPCGEVLSVGRVQTATLNIITSREHEIKNFIPKNYYVLQGVFTTKNNQVYIGTHSSKKFDSKIEANRLLSKLLQTDKRGVIISCKKKTYKKSKPHLYNLDSLQMDANKKYGFSLDTTLKIAQSLYEKGYTTYPRTDSVHLPEDMENEMKQVLNQIFNNPQYAHFKKPLNINNKNKFYFDNNKIESHYAIVPTIKPIGQLNDYEKKIYHLIVLSVICMVYSDATMSKTEIITSVYGEDFFTTGTSVEDAGFFQVMGMPKEKTIPKLIQKEIVNSEFKLEEKQTTPPDRYTAASLLSAMLNCGKHIEDEELKKLMANGPGGKPRGLGRPSSRASIVEKLEQRNYIITKGKTIFPTEKGLFMMKYFPVEDLKSAEMTALWEKRLDDIENGIDTYHNFMNDLEQSVVKWTNEIIKSKESFELHKKTNQTSFTCPVCGKELFSCKAGYGCCGYKTGDCRFFIGSIAGVRISDSNIKKLLNGETVFIKNMKNKQGTKFNSKVKMCFDEKQKGKLIFVK